MISIDNSVWDVLLGAQNSLAVKLFFFIATNQPVDGTRGFRITKKQLICDLQSSKTAIFRDLKWLKDNLLIHEMRLYDNFDFMANPHLVMNNSDRDVRIEEWNRRQRLDIQRDIRLKHERKLRYLRNANK